ncbi:gp53-like domain-containing protein [Enterobacter roggenkampii]|uniref:gp53-like domain-containing protein n=2 Tax=Enterobacter roggenkampii TaxID=1812935 RepID=UPI003D6E7E29
MLRIGQVEATATQDGKYTDGSVAGGIAATRLRAAAFNAMQEELAHIVESAGLALDINDMTQVLKAIQKLTLSRINPFADIKSDGAAAISTALANLGLGTVATKNVGTGSGQIPDMSSFNTGNTNSFRLPTGHFVPIGSGQTISGGFTQSYPTPFPNICQALVGVVYSTLGVRAFIATNTSDRTAANMNVVDQNGNGINVTVGYIAIGR